MLNDRVYKFSYEGPVRSLDGIVSSRWMGETYATSEARARSNLVYQYKKEHGLDVSAKITLTGKIEMK